MKSLILFSILASSLAIAKPKMKTPDPNGYFRTRSWSVDDGSMKNNHFIMASSEYRGEPIQTPNKLKVEHRCGTKKVIPMFELKYCGIDSVLVVAGKLEIMFTDYDLKDSMGYCRKKRTQRFEIPPCYKAKKKSKSSS